MRFWNSLWVFGAAVLLVACAAPRVLTPVELKEKELTELKATMDALGKDFNVIRARQLLLPKGSPGYLSVGREVALLSKKTAVLEQKLENKQKDLEKARRKETEAATSATNAPPVSSANTNATSTAQPVQTRGDLKLYPFTLTTDIDQGTKAVTGEVENTSPNAITDVSVAFNVLDADGQNVGTANDQTATLEPGVRWLFKALVLDSTAVEAEFLEFKVDGNPVTPLSTPPAPGGTP
jgi:hypothetical protein